METHILPRDGDDIQIRFWDTVAETYTDVRLSEMGEWQMQSIERELDERKQEEDRQARLRELRKDVLTRLTDEEKEALGLK